MRKFMNKIKISKLLLTTLIISGHAEAQNRFDLSWGLKNNGEAQIFDLSPLQTFRMQARVGEDIQLSTPVKGRKVKVAVVDTGVDVNHPSLKSQIHFKKEECIALQKYEQCVAENGAAGCEEMLVAGKNGVDRDGNLYPADCHGWSILAEPTVQNIIGTPSFSDAIGHGTHVAGIIASVSKNIEIVPIQVIGEAPNQPIKPFSIDLSPTEDLRGGFGSNPNLASRIARGIIYAINEKVDVINLSIGWPQGQDDQIMREAIEKAQQQGIVVVAAAGNDSTTALLRPCQYKGVICVAAHRPDGSIAHFSNYGYGVDIAAPGASIVSTIPNDVRSIRLPGYSGLDVLSGTSQAAPYVAGVVAELISRGIPSREIYARLVLGARLVKEELPVIVGPIQGSGLQVKSEEPYRKYVLSGLLDMKKSLAVAEQPLIVNSDKEIQQIMWDRKSSDLQFSFSIKNFWKSIQNQKIEVKLEIKNKLPITPLVSQVILEGDQKNFLSGEERRVQVNLKVADTLDPSQSKMPSDLLFKVDIYIDGKLHRSFDTKAEVIVEINKNYSGNDAISIPVLGKLERGMRKYLVDEIYDGKPNDRDYIALSQEEDGFNIALIKYQKNQYIVGRSQKISFDGNILATKPYSRVRLDIDGDGISEYVLGIQEFKESSGQYSMGDYIMHFYIFDDKMSLKKHVSFYDERALISLDFSWVRVGKELRPAWVGNGKNVVKKVDITDLWQVTPAQKTNLGVSDIYFYYLDENYRLANIENASDYKIVDIMQPQTENVQKGILPVLLAKNLGTPLKPSYLNDFSMGWVTQGKLSIDKTKLNNTSQLNYRNLIDTNKDKSLSLSKTSDEYLGTFWFGFDAHQQQRVTMIDFKNNMIVDKILKGKRSQYDAPLRVRAAFSSPTEKGVFLITNTEIEYHDLNRSTVARSSLNKYTFLGDDLMVDLQFPISLFSSNGQTKVPALFTTEGSGLNRGVRFLVPTQIGDKSNLEMISPARLRLSAPKGCRSIDSPVYVQGGYHLDYDCEDKILRFKLTY